jgi:hypothetical protein
MLYLIGVFLVVVSLSTAQAEPAGKEVLSQQLLKASGLEQQIAQIPDQVLSGIASQQATMPTEQYNILIAALKEAFHVQRLTVNVSARIEKNLDLETMRAALTWLHSDLGMKITGLEEAASTPQGVQQLQAYAQKLQTHPASPARLQLAERLDAVTYATDMLVNIVTATMLGVATAIDAAQVKERRIGAEALKAQLDLQRPALLQTYRPIVTASMLYTYQGVGDADMNRYIAFLESPPGHDYQTTVNAALIGALSDSSERLGTTLAGALKRLDKRKGI